MHKKMQVQKCNAKQIESKIRSTVTAKTQMPKMLLDTRLVHIWGACRCAVSVAWLSCIPVLEFGSHAICAKNEFSIRFGFLSLHQHLNGHINFQERLRVGGWHSLPSPSPRCCFSGKRGAHFPGDDPTEGPFVLFFFAFVLFCFFFVTFFLFFIVFVCWFSLFYISIFYDFFQKYPALEVPNSDRDLPFRLATCPLGRHEPQHCAFFFGFTGSPRTSLFKFNVSLVFCASFTTLSKCIYCFDLCCILHFLWPWLHFIWLYSPRIMSNLPTCIGSFHVFFICQVCPFPSCICSFYFSSISNFCLFSTCILLFHCSAIVMCAPFRFAFSNSIVLHCFSIFSKM